MKKSVSYFCLTSFPSTFSFGVLIRNRRSNNVILITISVCGTIYITVVGCDWRISIFTARARSCSLSGPLLYRLPVVFLDHGHPRFENFNSAIPVDVIRVKSYVDSFLDPSVKVR